MRPDTEQSYRQRILRVLVYLQQHLDEPLPLEDLARVACFSPYHFHRVFRGMVGESVKEHVRRLRLERAAQRLKATGQSVTAIALDDEGLTSAEAFAQVLNEPPKITSFIGSHGYGNTWTFSGTLEDESPTTCVVQLTGLPGLEPRQLSVAADGTFSVTVQLPADFTWVAIAQATDSLGQVSDAATFAST